MEIYETHSALQLWLELITLFHTVSNIGGFLMRILILIFAFAPTLVSQQLTFPRPSPTGSVSQTIGITEVSINYSRPGVKGREIWGKLVPYNEVWRTGANENTTITFSTEVTVGGTKLGPGTYGLQTIPAEKEWTVILSKDAKLWGAFNYKPENDAVRIKVTPEKSEFTERLTFTFDDVTDDAALVTLRWEKLKIAFDVQIETEKLAFDEARKAVRWQPFMQAASYTVTRKKNLEEGLKWADLSIAIEENYWNLRTKAQVLALLNRVPEAVKTMEKALSMSKTMDQAPFDLKQMEELLNGWKKKK